MGCKKQELYTLLKRQVSPDLQEAPAPVKAAHQQRAARRV